MFKSIKSVSNRNTLYKNKYLIYTILNIIILFLTFVNIYFVRFEILTILFYVVYNFLMRQNISVSVPTTKEVSYSLFSQGLLIDIPHNSNDGKSIIFNFQGGTVFSLFYTFANFRRAYLATAWQNENDGEPTFLPGIETPLYIILTVKGKKLDILKHVLYILTREDQYAPYKLPLDFWIKLSYLIEYKKAYKEDVFFLYNKYAKKGNKI